MAPPSDAECCFCWERGTEEDPLHARCACRGDMGFVHVQCQIKCSERDEMSWCNCGTCKQPFFGVVQLDLARARWERAQDRREEDRERLNAMDCLANALAGSLDYAAALRLYEQGLAIERRVNGDLDPNTLASIHNLAKCHIQQGDPSLALPLAEECLRGCRQTVGDEHTVTLSAMSTLSDVQREMGNHDEALLLAQRALATRRRTLGNQHFHTLISMNRAAVILTRMGDKEAALPLYEETMALQKRTLGSEHPETLWAIANAGTLHCELGRFGEGLPLIREAVAGRRKMLGEDHPHTLEAIETLEAYEAAAFAMEQKLEVLKLKLKLKLMEQQLGSVSAEFEAWRRRDRAASFVILCLSCGILFLMLLKQTIARQDEQLAKIMEHVDMQPENSFAVAIYDPAGL